MKIRNKGFIIYVTLSLMVILIAVTIAMHINGMTYRPTFTYVKETDTFLNSLVSVKAETQTIARYSVYPSVWAVGHNLTDQGVNYYLTLGDEEGKKKLKDDLLKGFTNRFNQYLMSWSKSSDNESAQYTIDSGLMPVTISRLKEEDVDVSESGDGMTFSYKLRLNTTWRNCFYDGEPNLTAEIPFRLFDMYDRSKNFHKNYANNIGWATTIALYVRAIKGSKDPTNQGSFIKEGHISYDPLYPLTYMDLEALKDGIHLQDAGSVPVATYLSEWAYLGEPSFLPPEADIDLEDFNPSKSLKMIRDLFDITTAADCSSLPPDKKTECDDFNDPKKIEQKAADLQSQVERLDTLSGDIDDWITDMNREGFNQMGCKIFSDTTTEMINKVVKEFNPDDPDRRVITPSLDYTKNTGTLEKNIAKNSVTINEIASYVGTLQTIRDSRLSFIASDPCHQDDDLDCKRVKSSDECVNPSCNGPLTSCPTGDDYRCENEKVGERHETVDCRTKCDEGDEECKPKDYHDTIYIDTCNCLCYPRPKIRDDVSKQLTYINNDIKSRMERLRQQVSELEERKKVLDKSNEMKSLVDTLMKNPVKGYDVVSSVRFNDISYNNPPQKCYYNPSWRDRLNGTCANGAESEGYYLAQVSAAGVCCTFFPACCDAAEYAARWFPVVYEVKGGFNVDEKLVDAKNRMMLHNEYAPDGVLYGFNETNKLFIPVAPEFVIYRNYTVSAKSMTLDRVMVYIDMEDTSSGNPGKKIQDSFADPTCKGSPC